MHEGYKPDHACLSYGALYYYQQFGKFLPTKLLWSLQAKCLILYSISNIFRILVVLWHVHPHYDIILFIFLLQMRDGRMTDTFLFIYLCLVEGTGFFFGEKQARNLYIMSNVAQAVNAVSLYSTLWIIVKEVVSVCDIIFFPLDQKSFVFHLFDPLGCSSFSH